MDGYLGSDLALRIGNMDASTSYEVFAALHQAAESFEHFTYLWQQLFS
jgi:hypothetical protein